MAGRVTSEGLSEKDIKLEEEFLKGVPFLNWGALFMPPIWGMAHGDWITILFYPLWIFCDNLFFYTYSAPTPLSIVLSVVVFVTMALVTVVYARLSSPRSAHRADDRGTSRERYLRNERIWAVSMAIMAVILIAAATWYNLCVKAPIVG